METIEEAIRARLHLDGQSLFIGCCTLSVQFSTMETLNIPTNASPLTCRDYKQIREGNSTQTLSAVFPCTAHLFAQSQLYAMPSSISPQQDYISGATVTNGQFEGVTNTYKSKGDQKISQMHKNMNSQDSS